MATLSGPNYSVESQITFIVQWFRTWSELQKDDFVEILAQKLTRGNNVNGLVNGMQKLDTGSSRPVSLFSCQMKLFNEWWDSWPENEKQNLTSRLKDSDSKFWAEVQEEINGTRKKLEDDFFLTINNSVGENIIGERNMNSYDEAETESTTINTADEDTTFQNGHQLAEEIEDADGNSG